jgi:hypothetical protein
MTIDNYYASIAVVELTSDKKILIESISVTKGECVLSGAWDFSITERENISNVLSGRLLIALGDENKFRDFIDDSSYVYLTAKPFLDEARIAASDALLAYENFKAENPTKRKKMVAPDFYDWPDAIDFNHSAKFMESIGKMATPLSTPSGFKNVLATARLVKHLIDMWHLDEQDRSSRKYVEGEDAEITILPRTWLNLVAPH